MKLGPTGGRCNRKLKGWHGSQSYLEKIENHEQFSKRELRRKKEPRLPRSGFLGKGVLPCETGEEG